MILPEAVEDEAVELPVMFAQPGGERLGMAVDCRLGREAMAGDVDRRLLPLVGVEGEDRGLVSRRALRQGDGADVGDDSPLRRIEARDQMEDFQSTKPVARWK